MLVAGRALGVPDSAGRKRRGSSRPPRDMFGCYNSDSGIGLQGQEDLYWVAIRHVMNIPIIQMCDKLVQYMHSSIGRWLKIRQSGKCRTRSSKKLKNPRNVLAEKIHENLSHQS